MACAWLGPLNASASASAPNTIKANLFGRFCLFTVMPHFLPSHSFGRDGVTGDSPILPQERDSRAGTLTATLTAGGGRTTRRAYCRDASGGRRETETVLAGEVKPADGGAVRLPGHSWRSGQ